MDVATGLIHGMEFLNALADEPSEFESRRLLNASELKAGKRPKYLLVDSSHKVSQLAKAATVMGLEVVPEKGSNLDPITREAREGLAAHVLRGGR